MNTLDSYLLLLFKSVLIIVLLKLKRMGIDIMGLAEVRWLQSGKIVCNDHTLIYSGHKKDNKHDVGLLLSKVVSKSVLGYCALSDRILFVRIHGKPFNLSIIQVCALTSVSSERRLKTSTATWKMHTRNVVIRIL